MELMEVDHGPGGKWDVRPWTVSDFARVIDRWQQGLLGTAWPANFLSNHDQPRAVSRFGDEGGYRRESAMLLATLLFTLSGTPFVYYGEEIGMLNGNYPSIEQYRDIDTLQYYEAELARGTPKDQVMAMVRYMSRDNARGPMQFDASPYGGFSESQPWIPVGPSHDTVNVAADLQSERSVYRYYQRMIGLRREHRALSHGWYVPVHPSAERVVAYEKRLDGDHLLVVLNMGRSEAQCRASELPALDSAERTIGNYPPSSREADATELRLRPFEAVVYRLTGAEPTGT
jgi:oligo-1,6-glucosidase